MNSVITTENLKVISELKRIGDLEKWLKSENIRYFNSKKGPWTTVGLIEAAKGLVNGSDLGSSNDEDLL